MTDQQREICLGNRKMDNRFQERKIRYYLVQGQGWSRAYIYSAIAEYLVGTYVIMPALDLIGYGWDAIVKGEIIDVISEEEAYQMLPRTVEEPKSIICSISSEEFENASFRMTKSAMRKRMETEMAAGQ